MEIKKNGTVGAAAGCPPSVKHPSLDFGSGCQLRVMKWAPRDLQGLCFLLLLLPLPLFACAHALSQINLNKNKKER